MADIEDEGGIGIEDEAGVQITDEGPTGYTNSKAGDITPAGAPSRLLGVNRTMAGDI